jgi:hypothetical protein
MWPTNKIRQVAEDAAGRIEVSVGALTGALALMAAGILLCLVGIATLLLRDA